MIYKILLIVLLLDNFVLNGIDKYKDGNETRGSIQIIFGVSAILIILAATIVSML